MDPYCEYPFKYERLSSDLRLRNETQRLCRNDVVGLKCEHQSQTNQRPSDPDDLRDHGVAIFVIHLLRFHQDLEVIDGHAGVIVIDRSVNIGQRRVDIVIERLVDVPML